MIKNKSLEKHPICNLNREELILIAKILLDAKQTGKKPSLTEKQILLNGLFNHLSEIEGKLKDIKISKFLLKSSKIEEHTGKENYTRSDHIKYHLEFYQINVIAIFDRTLHLINFIYKLGLSNRYVTKDIICSNSNIPKILINLIKEFDKNIDPIRRVQNNIKHKEKIDLPELHEAELLDHVLWTWKEIKYKKLKVDLNWTKKDENSFLKESNFYYKIFLKKEIDKINMINNDLNGHIWKILDILSDEFQKQI